MNDAIRQKLVDAAYMSVTPAFAREGMRRITTEEWLELRAASAIFQAQNGHSLANVYAFITDISTYPASLGAPPPELRERLLFAYSFVLAGEASGQTMPSASAPETPADPGGTCAQCGGAAPFSECHNAAANGGTP